AAIPLLGSAAGVARPALCPRQGSPRLHGADPTEEIGLGKSFNPEPTATAEAAMYRALFFCTISAAALAAEPGDQEFFEKKVRPILAGHCFECHGGGKKLRGGLNLTNRQGLFKGGDTGPVIDPGHPERSRLTNAIRYTGDLKMPPRGKLAEEQVA